MRCEAKTILILSSILIFSLFPIMHIKPVNAAPIWHTTELWWFNVHAPTWHSVENWTVTFHAFHRGMAWEDGIAFLLEDHSTYVSFEDTAYFDAYQLTESNITFWNVSMWLGYPISNLTVSTQGADIVFTEVDAERIVQFDVTTGNGATVWYSQFWNLSDTMPFVKWENTWLSNGTYWMWNETNRLSTWYIAPLEVLFTWCTPVEEWLLYPYTGGAPFYTPLPFPLIAVFGLVGLVCMFGGPLYGISKFRKKEYRSGAVTALIIFVVGFALFIGWLWSAG